MKNEIEAYRSILGAESINELYELANLLKGIRIVHVNSTRVGGGVAEILAKMVPLTNSLGLHTRWEVIQGENEFFRCTKMFHNLLQDQESPFPPESLLQEYEETNAKNGTALNDLLREADIVFIHDPQPLPLIAHVPNRKGKWFWRCHIDLSNPSHRTWEYLKRYCEAYDATVFSLPDFAQQLPHPVYIIAPSIDPLSEKNIELKEEEIATCFNQLNIDRKRPTLLQVSRFDRFKDPLGVIKTYQLAKKAHPDLQLVLAGSSAVDDPEGEEVLNEVKEAVACDPDIYLLLLPPTSHRTINALQRGASIVLQKSLKEGFGLTVTEALWKSKPVIGGNTGGIRIQINDSQTGFLVNSPEEAASRIQLLLQNKQLAKKLGVNGRELVKERFLITRHLKEYLTIMAAHLFPKKQEVKNLIKKVKMVNFD